jgi:uncharacterized membrane protein
MNIVLWILQILLTLLFLFAGVTKFFLTPEAMRQAAPDAIQLPMAFVYFIGVVETLGALGLLLPGLLKTKRFLTPLAALGLTVVMLGAVVVTIMGPGVAAAIPPLVIGALCAAVAYGRRDWK